MALKLISLGRGASGVRLELIRLIEGMLRTGRHPGHPGKGFGRRLRRPRAARAYGRDDDRRGRGLLRRRAHGGQGCAAEGGACAGRAGGQGRAGADQRHADLDRLGACRPVRAHRAAQTALVTGAISTDAAYGLVRAVPSARSTRCAATRARSRRRRRCARLLAGSEIRESHRRATSRVQDPYCIRCQPQVTGACLDLLRQVARDAGDRGQRRHRQPAGAGRRQVVSGGNFHAEPVAFAADQIGARHLRDRRDRAAAHRAAGRPDARPTACRRS